jgi:hypothetical protein
MMNEQDDSLIRSSDDEPTPSGDEHICTDPDTCTADQPQEHLVTPESFEAPVVTKFSKIKKHATPRNVVLGIIALFVVVVGGLSSYVYTHASTDKTVRAITTKLPFPALILGRSVVTFNDFYKEQDSLKRYFATSEAQTGQVPDDEQMQSMIVQTLVNKAVVEKLANDYGVKLVPSKVQEFYQSFLDSNVGSTEESIKQQLQETFGWTPEQFKKQIIEPIALSTEVATYVAESPFFQKPLKDEIESAHKRVTTEGEDFVTVGTEVHERVQIDLKSDLGFVNKSDLPESWASYVVDLETGKTTEIVELPQGYAIFKVSDRIKSQEKAGKTAVTTDEQLHLLTITVPKKTLEQVVQDYLAKTPMTTLIKM